MCYPIWGGFGPHYGMFIFPFLFFTIFCVFLFFVIRGCRPFFRQDNTGSRAAEAGGCWPFFYCWPFFRRDDTCVQKTESDLAEEINKLKMEIQELKDTLRRK
jgi:hypothetical protein